MLFEIHPQGALKVLQMINGNTLVGLITFVPKGKGKQKRQTKYGFIGFNQIRTPEGVLAAGLPKEDLWLKYGLDPDLIGRDGLHVSIDNMQDKSLLAEGSLIRFKAGPGNEGLLTAIEVEKFEPDPASALEPAAVEPIVEKAPAQPVFVREAVKVDASNLVEEQSPLTDYRYEPKMGGLEALYARTEKDPEARLKGVEAVLESSTSSSETAWATIRPAVVGLGKILWQLLLGAIDLGRWLWKAGKNFIADRRARKSAA